MNRQDLLIAIVTLDYDTVRSAIEKGIDFNQPIPGKRPLIEAAQPGKDPTMLHLLWRARATPTTPWLEKVFTAFENGINSPLLQMDNESTESETIVQDLTDNFSVSLLKFGNGKLSFRGSQGAIHIPIKPFVLDGKKIHTAISLEGIALRSPIEALANQTLQFPINPSEGYIDGSIYLRNIHNPIDVTSITFGQISNDHRHILSTLVFDFLLEDIGFQNERLIRFITLEVER